MSFACKHKSLCKIFTGHKKLGCNFSGNREMFSRTYAEGRASRQDIIAVGGNQIVAQPTKPKEEVFSADRTHTKATQMDKICLMWHANYKSPDDIPEYVNKSELNLAKRKRLIVFNVWFLTLLTVFLVTIIKCGQYRVHVSLLRLQEEQDKAWASRQDLMNEMMVKKKKGPEKV